MGIYDEISTMKQSILSGEYHILRRKQVEATACYDDMWLSAVKRYLFYLGI